MDNSVNYILQAKCLQTILFSIGSLKCFLILCNIEKTVFVLSKMNNIHHYSFMPLDKSYKAFSFAPLLID